MILDEGMRNAISDESTQNLRYIFLGSTMVTFSNYQGTQIVSDKKIFYMRGNSRELKKMIGNSKISNTGSFSPVTE
jgi:hypothetical protein